MANFSQILKFNGCSLLQKYPEGRKWLTCGLMTAVLSSESSISRSVGLTSLTLLLRKELFGLFDWMLRLWGSLLGVALFCCEGLSFLGRAAESQKNQSF